MERERKRITRRAKKEGKDFLKYMKHVLSIISTIIFIKVSVNAQNECFHMKVSNVSKKINTCEIDFFFPSYSGM